MRQAYADGEVVAREIVVRRQGEALSVPLPMELPRRRQAQEAKAHKIQASVRVGCRPAELVQRPHEEMPG